ncbi:MAG: glycyl-radical enzyme activating protein [Clostridiales bacterium]|jgi:pyruvate formate lyase activating enzyme|nr:glycyl-radical enzyme activating protein [Clostridiales bacterium]
MSETGVIFDIQRFSLHDGPGIRTIVFLKGCGMRCRWCCNPESQRREPETMSVDGRPRTVGRRVSVAETMDVVLRDAAYYRRSGGGLTLSGGECLLQPEFAAALLAAAKSAGLNTAVESAAFADTAAVDAVLPYTDRFLLDIKHMDSAKHKAFCGQPNERIHGNAQRIAESGDTELTARVPVIPGFNDTAPEIAAIAAFAKRLGAAEICLLPYHGYGAGKYAGLGREYPMGSVRPPDGGTMARLAEAARGAAGVRCRIGG